MGERFVETLGFELARIEGTYYVLKRGGVYVKQYIPDDEVSLRPIATCTEYDDPVQPRDGAP